MLTERVWFNQIKKNKEKKTIENCFLCNYFLWCLFVLVFWTICKLILGSIAFYGINFFFLHFLSNFSLCCCAYAIMLYGCSWLSQSLSFGGRVVFSYSSIECTTCISIYSLDFIQHLISYFPDTNQIALDFVAIAITFSAPIFIGIVWIILFV